MTRRVAVVGMGVVSPAGSTLDALQNTTREAISCGTALGWEMGDCPVDFGCPAPSFDPSAVLSAGEIRRTDRGTQFALVAAAAAIDQAGGLDHHPATRRAAIVGSGSSGLGTWAASYDGWLDRGYRSLTPFIIPMIMPNASAGLLSLRYGLEGPSLSVGGACAAGTHGVIDGARLIRDDLADVVIAGGTEALLLPIILAAFARTGAMSRRSADPSRASRPFDRDRDGFVLGEGAGVLVLEEYSSAVDRGATIFGEIAGFGLTSDAHHIAAPRDDGGSIIRAMRLALADAGLDPTEIGHVNAHGTSTVANDSIEARAIGEVFAGAPPPVTSVKGSIGHLIGGAGPVELIAGILAMNAGEVPPVANFEVPSDDIDLDVVHGEPRRVPPMPFLKNSFAFGGHNASVVVTPPPVPPPDPTGHR